MKTKFLLSTVLVLTCVLAACAPQAAPTKKAVEPPAKPAVTEPTATLSSPATKASSKSSTTSAKPKTTSAKPTPTTFAPPTSSTSSTAVVQTPAATLTPGPAIINNITVNDQLVKSGTVLISMVDALKPGWVAIFTDDNGKPGKVLGYVAVPAGESSDIKVPVDASGVTTKMIAMLLVDAGQIGTFEYPGADEPVKNANMNENVMAVFNRASQ